jgi:hypothetical protein
MLIIIGSFAVLQLSPKVLAQAQSEGAKVLVDDVIQDLKSMMLCKALLHTSPQSFREVSDDY